MSHRLSWATLLLACCMSPPVIAQVVTDDAVIVTATRTAQTADDSLAAVSVITRADIERSQATDVVQLLRDYTGIDVVRSGGLGQQTSVFMRGTESNHVLVLIDGVRAASPATGIFNWANLPPSQIERIEIVRGPRAALYGSDAVGGVIQIFTRKTDGPSVRAETGRYGTHALQAGFGGGDRISFSVNAEDRSSNGFSATNPRAGFDYDPDKDRYSNRNLGARLQAALPGDGKFELTGLHSISTLEQDPGRMEALNDVIGARLATPVTANWTQTFSLGIATDRQDTRQPYYNTNVDTQRFNADWQHDWEPVAGQLVVFGLTHTRDTGDTYSLDDSATVYDRSSHNNAAFAEWQFELAGSSFQISARHDRHSSFGGHNTAQLAWGHDLNTAWHAYASYGSAFKAPDLNDLFNPGYPNYDYPGNPCDPDIYPATFAGNPDLAPETSRSAELGAIWRPAAHTELRASLFDNRIENLIATGATCPFALDNLGRAHTRGLEIEHQQTLGTWQLRTSATLQQARNTDAGTDLLRRPKAKLALQLTRNLTPQLTASAEGVLSGSHEDFDNITYGRTRVGGYGIVNLMLHYRLAADWAIEGRVENILDKDYEIASGYNTPARSLFLSLRYQIANTDHDRL